MLTASPRQLHRGLAMVLVLLAAVAVAVLIPTPDSVLDLHLSTDLPYDYGLVQEWRYHVWNLAPVVGTIVSIFMLPTVVPDLSGGNSTTTAVAHETASSPAELLSRPITRGPPRF